MYLANNIHPALVLVDPTRNADSTWHSWMSWQVLGELIFSAFPPLPLIQVSIQNFLLTLTCVTQLGTHLTCLGCWYTPHVRAHSLPSHGQGDSLWASVPQLEADIQTSACCGGLSKRARRLASLQTPHLLSCMQLVSGVWAEALPTQKAGTFPATLSSNYVVARPIVLN